MANITSALLAFIGLTMATTPTAAADFTIDNIVRDHRGRVKAYLTVTPDRYSRMAIAECYLLVDGKPIDDTAGMASDVTGPTRISMEFPRSYTGDDATIDCSVTFY